jgi:hypothetical protein
LSALLVTSIEFPTELSLLHAQVFKDRGLEVQDIIYLQVPNLQSSKPDGRARGTIMMLLLITKADWKKNFNYEYDEGNEEQVDGNLVKSKFAPVRTTWKVIHLGFLSFFLF